MAAPVDLSAELQGLKKAVEGKMEEKEAGNRGLAGGPAVFAKWLAVVYTLFHLYTAAAGIFPILVQRSLHVGGGLMLAFLLYIARKGDRGRSPAWWEWAMVVFSGAIPIYVTFNYDRWMDNITSSNFWDLTFGLLALVVVLEASRRVIGWVFPLLGILFIGYAYFGRILPSPWRHAAFNWRVIIENLFMSNNGLWGTTTAITSTIVAMFIIFGAFLAITGGGKAFMDIALVLSGRQVGGPAKVATISSGLFGTISGSAAANVAVTGSFTIPMMKRLGYGANFAGAVEATASSGGQIMPPIMGAGAFVMAELLGISYLQVAKAAAIPAILFYVGVFMAIHFEALKRGLKGLPAEVLPRAREILSFQALGPFLVPTVLLLWLLGQGYTPMKAGFTATAVAAGLYLLSDPRALLSRLKRLFDCLEGGGYALVLVAVLAACAQIIVGIIGFTGFGVKLSNAIITASGGYLLPALVLAMVVCLVLGMGMPTTAAYLLAASVVGPALTKLGVLPLPAHMFLFYFAIISAITPPVCAAVFVAAGMARGHWVTTAWIACRLGLAAFIAPYMFVSANELLLIGDLGQIILAAVTATLGTVALAAGAIGHGLRPNRWWENVLLLAGALTLIKSGLLTDLVGLVLVGAVFGPQVLAWRARTASAVAASRAG